MPRNNDFLTAIAAGTLLGIGAGLLLRPRKHTARDRLLRELQPYRDQLRRTRASGAEAEDDSPELIPLDGMEGDAIDVGRELLKEFRDEVRQVLEEARSELAELAGAAGERSGRARRALQERLGGSRPADDPYDYEDDGERD